MSDSEDDFEQELLQAVGRAGRSGGRSGGGDGGRKGGGGGGNRRSSKGGRSRRSGFRSSSSSEDQPSDNEDDDDEHEDIEERERARGARGSAGAEGKTDTRSRGNVSPPRGSGFRSGGGGGGGGNRGGGRGSGSDEDRRARGSGGGDGDSESSGLSFGSDLYKDDDDRERLQAMNEIDREQILFERDERRRSHLDKRELRKKLRQQQKLHPQQQQSFQRTQERTPRASAREPAASPAAPPPAAATAATTPEPAARGAPASGSAPGSVGGPSYTPPGSAVARARGFGGVERSRKEDALQQLEAKKAAKQQRRNDLDADRGADRDASDDGGSDDASRRKPPAPSPADAKPPASAPPVQVRGAHDVQVPGLDCKCLMSHPYPSPLALRPPSAPFSSPPVQVRGAHDVQVPGLQYKFEGRMTCKFLDCKWGEHRARWQMARVSDKAANTQEILQLFREIERAHLHRVTKAAVQEKKAELESVRGYVYSAEVVASMLREKRAAAAKPKLVVMERERVRLDIAAAEQRGDLGAVEQLKAELEKLERIGEDKGEANKGRREVDLARMNKRNRQENFRTATNAPAGATETKTGEAAVDPFIRRWTRSQNYYKSPAAPTAAAAPWSDDEDEGAGKDGGGKSKDGKGKDGKGEKGKEGKDADGKGGGAEEEREKEREKERERQLGSWLGQQLDERSKQVLRKHAFDMDIDLSVVDKWGGAGAAAAAQRGSVGPAVWEAAFLARKRQQEALYGAPIGVAAGETPRGLRLLTLSEYKRRRGLPCD
ncbi:unnamed protein product [Closterium sp. NIES-65]|nr:unnamed protein product [Closterium sp. NIES-65]